MMQGDFQGQQVRGSMNPGLPFSKVPAFLIDPGEASKRMLDTWLNRGEVHVMADAFYVAPRGRTRTKGRRGRELPLKQSGLFKWN